MHSLSEKQSVKLFEDQHVYWLHYYFEEDIRFDSTVFMELDLPTPTMICFSNRGYRYAWAVDGYFGTAAGKQYVRDVKDRLAALFTHYDIRYQDISWIEPMVDAYTHVYDRIYYLREFEIEDLRVRKSKEHKWKKEVDAVLYGFEGKSHVDRIFEATRQEVYALKREGRLSYENVFAILERVNLELFQGKYSYAEIRGKARRMHEWTEAFYTASGRSRREYFKFYMRQRRRNENEGQGMSRTEAAEHARATKSDITQDRVRSAVAMLKSSGKLYKKNGEVNVSKVAKIAGVNRRSAGKYV